MGQKVNPISNRLGVIRGWDSNWSEKGKFPANILEDYKLREYLNVRLAKCSVSRVVIERTLKLITITICTSRPGLIIGQGGKDVEALKKELSKITDAFYMVDKSRSRKQGGAGLGLSICKEILTLHKFDIAFDSAVGVGTTVTITMKEGTA